MLKYVSNFFFFRFYQIPEICFSTSFQHNIIHRHVLHGMYILIVYIHTYYAWIFEINSFLAHTNTFSLIANIWRQIFMYVKAHWLNSFVIFPNFNCHCQCSQLPHVCIRVTSRTWKCINMLAPIDVIAIFSKIFEVMSSVFCIIYSEVRFLEIQNCWLIKF